MQLIDTLATKDNIGLAIVEKDLTLQTAMKGTMISKLEKTIDSRKLINAIAYIITRGVSVFNVKRNITEDQAVLIAVDLIEVYKFETVEDIIMLFKMARQGKIGSKLYQDIDTTIVLGEWMPEYLELKADERQKEHKENKGKDIPLNKIQLDALDKYNEIKKAQPEEKPKEIELMSVDGYSNWIKHLPETCKHLTLFDLKVQIKRAKNTPDQKPFEIYTKELNRRKGEK